MGDLGAWLADVHPECAALRQPLAADFGITQVAHLHLLEPPVVDKLAQRLKLAPAKLFRSAIAALPSEDGVPSQPSVAQGDRIAAGLGPIAPMGSLAGLFRPLAESPQSPAFLASIRPIAAAGCMANALSMAKVTLATAADQKQFGQLQDDPLSVDGIAFLMKYSAEDTDPPFYKDMNTKAYDANRQKIRPYGPYIVGTLRQLRRLEPYPNAEVFRGVRADLRAAYAPGREFTWHGFSSTTKSIGVLSNAQFCGDQGTRTIFAIRLTQSQARDITRYSLVQAEDEVLLPPGCRFRVKSSLDAGHGLSIIQLEELPSDEWIIDLSQPSGEPEAPEPELDAAPGPAPEPELAAGSRQLTLL